MKIKHSFIGLSIFSLIALSSCFDNDYDLSDIDTTVKVQTKNLVVPINLDAITLDQVLDLDEGSEIIDTIDTSGKRIYAIKKEGSFGSDNINVEAFTISAPSINFANVIFTNPSTPDFGDVLQGQTYEYNLVEAETSSFESSPVQYDESVKDILKLGVDATFTSRITVTGFDDAANVSLEELKIQYPAGMTLNSEASTGVYDPETGILDLSNESNILTKEITLHVTEIANNGVNVQLNKEEHTVVYAGEIKVIAGKIKVSNVTTLPETVTLTITPTVDDIQVSSFSGVLEYNVDDFNIEPIDISDLPDVFNQSGTEIRLENPQIYLSLTNPVSNVWFQTGFQMTAERDKNTESYQIDNGTFDTKAFIGKEESVFVLSPANPEAYIEGYNAAQWVPFSGLRNVLAEVDGIPTTIKVDVLNPQMPTQEVLDFKLGAYEGMEGKYTFYAPLQLSDPSYIAYTDTIDGWNDEDVDKITIEKLVLNFDATIELPFALNLTVYPIDKNGKKMEGVAGNAHIPANAKDVPTEVAVTGTIKHLDGIIISAKVATEEGQDNPPLSPQMTLQMKNSKVTVTGSYEEEL